MDDIYERSHMTVDRVRGRRWRALSTIFVVCGFAGLAGCAVADDGLPSEAASGSVGGAVSNSSGTGAGASTGATGGSRSTGGISISGTTSAAMTGASGGIGTAGGQTTGVAGISDGGSGPDDAGGRRDGGGGNNTGGPSTAGGSDGGNSGRATEGGTSTGGAISGGGSAGDGGTVKKFVGNITTRGQVRSDFSMYWDEITPENEGKWGSVEGVRNQMNWSGLDRVHDYAKQHNLVFKQHNFVWGNQQPSWLGGLSADQQKAEVEEWIRLFCERYPDVQLIDVVNEPPPHTTPIYMNALGGAGASGYDWIVQAFKWAHQYCPDAILILNDYNNVELTGDNNHTIDIVNRIKAAGAPIDAVGAQAHGAWTQSAAAVQGFIDNITNKTGLPVYITEYDINAADDNQQKNVMQSQMTMFWNDENVAGITVWGYVVGSTWEANTGLMTSAGQMRPAMTWLMQFLGR